MKAVFDTNILIDYLNGIEAARTELAHYTTRQISVISFIEVLVGAKSSAEENAIRGFLGTFEILNLSAEIANQTIEIRKKIPPENSRRNGLRHRPHARLHPGFAQQQGAETRVARHQDSLPVIKIPN